MATSRPWSVAVPPGATEADGAPFCVVPPAPDAELGEAVPLGTADVDGTARCGAPAGAGAGDAAGGADDGDER